MIRGLRNKDPELVRSFTGRDHGDLSMRYVSSPLCYPPLPLGPHRTPILLPHSFFSTLSSEVPTPPPTLSPR
jgi:hypothetical protein